MHRKASLVNLLVVLPIFVLVLALNGAVGSTGVSSPPAFAAQVDPAPARNVQVTQEDTTLQDCGVMYRLSPGSGTTVPGGVLGTTFTTEWLGGPCSWTVSLSSEGAEGITLTFEPETGQVDPGNTVWESTGTIAVAPAVSPGFYQLRVHVDATVEGGERPRRTFVYGLFVAPPPSATPTFTTTPDQTPGTGPTPTSTVTPGGPCGDALVILSSNTAMLLPGTSTLRTITVGQVKPANAVWTFDTEVVPSGILVDFTPASFAGIGSTQMHVSAHADVAPGDYSFGLRFMCNGAGVEATNFSLTVSPFSTPVATATATVTLTPAAQTPTATTSPTPEENWWGYLPLIARSVRPTPTPTPIAVPIYVDDFSDPSSGWPTPTPTPTGSVTNGDVGYQDGEYRTHVKAGVNVAMAGGPPRSFTDFDLEVSARTMNEPFSGAYFLIFRYQDNNNYYFARISPSEGNLDLYKTADGVRTQLVAPTDSQAIQAGTATNRLRVVAQGATIRLYANGQLLTEVADSSFSHGNLLLGAWNYSQEQALTVHWDDVVVYGAGDRPMSVELRKHPRILSLPAR